MIDLMKVKKGAPLILITGLLISLGSRNAESVQKNKLMTEQNIIKSESVFKDITKEQAKERTLKLFEKYFDEKVDVNSLIEKIELLKVGDKYNFEEKDHWSVSWSTFDYNRLKNTKNMTRDEIKQLNEDWHNDKSYYAKLEKKNGKIIEIGIIDGKRDGNLTIEELREKEIETEDAKNIALDYIKKNKLVNNIEDLEFLGEIRVMPEFCAIAYKYGEDKAVKVYVDSLSKKVSGFGYENEQKVKEGIEINKNYKTDGAVG